MLIKTLLVGAHLNHLGEAILMSNVGFYEEISKIIPQLSSNTHLISSSASILTKTGTVLCTLSVLDSLHS